MSYFLLCQFFKVQKSIKIEAKFTQSERCDSIAVHLSLQRRDHCTRLEARGGVTNDIRQRNVEHKVWRTWYLPLALSSTQPLCVRRKF